MKPQQRKRISYINTILLSRCPWILLKKHNTEMDYTRITQRQIDIANTLKIIHACIEPISNDSMYRLCKIRMKKRYLFYKKFCLDMNFIQKSKGFYTITDNGVEFYRLLVTP